MNNLKDILTTIFGVAGAISVALMSVPSLPEWLHITAISVAASSIGVVGYFNGKTATGKTKSDVDLMKQEELNPPKLK